MPPDVEKIVKRFIFRLSDEENQELREEILDISRKFFELLVQHIQNSRKFGISLCIPVLRAREPRRTSKRNGNFLIVRVEKFSSFEVVAYITSVKTKIELDGSIWILVEVSAKNIEFSFRADDYIEECR